MLKGAQLAAMGCFLWGAAAQAEEPAQGKLVYAVAWTSASAGQDRAVVEQADKQLRAELTRRGARVVREGQVRDAIVLMPKLEVSPEAVSLSLVKVGADRALLGAVKARAAGPHRDAKLQKLVERAVDEVARL